MCSTLLSEGVDPPGDSDELRDEDNNGAKTYAYTLQRIPLDPSSIVHKTTCRNPYCRQKDRAFQPGVYRISIEDRAVNFEAGCQWNVEIPLEPTIEYGPALKYGARAHEKRGEGKDVIVWWCLHCIEAVWLKEEGFKIRARDRQGAQPDRTDLGIIDVEDRVQGPHNAEYCLSDPQICSVEKWKAVINFDDRAKGIYQQPGYVLGREPGTLYENQQARDEIGIDELTGDVIEVSVTEVRGQKLSEVLRLVDEKVAACHQRFYEAEAEYEEFLRESNNETGDVGGVVEGGEPSVPAGTATRQDQRSAAEGEQDEEAPRTPSPRNRIRFKKRKTREIASASPKPAVRIRLSAPDPNYPSNQLSSAT